MATKFNNVATGTAHALQHHGLQRVAIADFDAHREDHMGGPALQEAHYHWATEVLKDVASRHASGRIVSVLEGGYALSALGRSVMAHIKSLADL